MKTSLDVLRVELLQLARDRRALFSAIVLPALLYPLLFWGTGALQTVGEETMAERTVRALVDLSRADAETARAEAAEQVERATAEVRRVERREQEFEDWSARLSWSHAIQANGWGRNFPTTDIVTAGVRYVLR